MIVRANSVQERRVLAIRPAPLSVGMFAWLFLFPVSGRRFFRSFDGPKRATVGFGQILTTIDLNRLEPISNAEYKKATRELRPAAPPTNFSTAERRLQFHEQIDVRGMRVAEAVETVQDFVDEAIMLGFSEIRILHGKGTGALKEEIRSYLRTVPLVRSAKDEHEEMGGAGITVVKLDI